MTTRVLRLVCILMSLRSNISSKILLTYPKQNLEGQIDKAEASGPRVIYSHKIGKRRVVVRAIGKIDALIRVGTKTTMMKKTAQCHSLEYLSYLSQPHKNANHNHKTDRVIIAFCGNVLRTQVKFRASGRVKKEKMTRGMLVTENYF